MRVSFEMYKDGIKDSLQKGIGDIFLRSNLSRPSDLPENANESVAANDTLVKLLKIATDPENKINSISSLK